MNRPLLALYHRAPGPLRTAAATLEGLRLAAWRYGPETAELVDEALERDFWSAARWAAWREERLARMLDRAARRVPYYRAIWARRRMSGDRVSWERLENWPLLAKAELRGSERAFIAGDIDPRAMFVERTSGTSGTPLSLYRSRRALRAIFAVYRARRRRWHGVADADPWALAGGQLVAARERTRPPYWVWNAAGRQIYVSSYHLAPDQARASLAEIARRGCRAVWGYPSSLAALAAAAELPLAGVASVVTLAEPLAPSAQARIERAFGAAARENYGLVEAVAAAGECPEGRLHGFPDFGVVEHIGGEIVATGLLDEDMPLIRYRTGDRGGHALDGAACSCGRTLPLWTPVEGRLDDLFWSRDGRPVGRLDPLFKADLPIREAQLVQESLALVRAVVAPAAGWSATAERGLARAIRERLGDVEVRVELVEFVPRGPNGKFRACVSRLPEGAARAEGVAC